MQDEGTGRIITNAVLEAEFLDLIRQGHVAEVVSRAVATRKAAVWYGDWILRLTDREGSFEKYLAVTRDERQIRAFKTANGLISFMTGIGFPAVTIPMEPGGRAAHRLSDRQPGRPEIPPLTIRLSACPVSRIDCLVFKVACRLSLVVCCVLPVRCRAPPGSDPGYHAPWASGSVPACAKATYALRRSAPQASRIEALGRHGGAVISGHPAFAISRTQGP